jgi:hypothetical protein
MSAIVSLGIDLAKNVFALHGVDAAGKPVLVPPNDVGVEAKRQQDEKPASKAVKLLLHKFMSSGVDGGVHR